MNLCSFDTQNHPIQIGDTITLIDTLEYPDQLQHIAQQTHSIVYEILVKLSPGLKRVIERQ
jgi:alanine racemase